MTPTGQISRTLAEARAEVADDILAHDAYRTGWARGYTAALDLMGVDTDPETALSTGQVTVHDPLMDAVAARRRAALAEVRRYRGPSLTAAQIAAQAAFSWRQVEREIASRQRVSA